MTVDEPGRAAATTAATTTEKAGERTRSTRPGGHRAPPGPEAGRGGGASAGSSAGNGAGHAGGGLGGGWATPEPSRSRRSLTTALTALGIAIGAAVVLGLLVAFLTRGVGASSKDPASSTPSLTIPAGDAASSASGGVPADWTEQTTSSGLAFKAPPGWTQRTDAVVDYRVDPNGPEQVGVGLSTAGDADSAVTSYAQNTYSGQTAFAAQPAADATGARGERARQVTLTYTRQGTPVTVVVRAVPTARGVVVISTRSAADNPERAAQLADSTDASLQRP